MSVYRQMSTLAVLFATSFSASAEDHPTQLLFGDTHVHTSYSFDAFLNQNKSADPETALRYARGLPVVHPYHRARVQIGRPLDFMVVSDHAELLGLMPAIATETAELEDLGLWGNIKRWYTIRLLKKAMNSGLEGSSYFATLLPETPGQVDGDPVQHPVNKGAVENIRNLLGDMTPIVRHAWTDITDKADLYNEPGVFTALVGWEWSSIPVGANLHRVVISPDGAEISQQYLPYGADQSQYPQDLWNWMDATTDLTGARFLAIPHNSNISKGFMFARTTLKGEEMSPDYTRNRLRHEPLVEITQIKGDSETHPDLSPGDPYADFEAFPFYIQSNPTPYKAAPGDYVRPALKAGLELEKKTGTNPYQFGVIGSTDSHTGLASIEEDNFWGKLAVDSIPENKSLENISDLPEEFKSGKTPTGWDMSAQGLAAVWATENTREAIFEAMQRREVYATTGPRIQVRFFGSWDFEAGDAQDPDLAGIGYDKGVPMGSTLQAADSRNTGEAPGFLVQVAKDPEGADLDRVQVIKGWLDASGQTHEKIYTIHQPGSEETGFSSFSTVWADPEFNDEEAAFYYLRVLETPTQRHSYLDKQALMIEPEASDTIQERAYSSAIWYKPSTGQAG